MSEARIQTLEALLQECRQHFLLCPTQAALYTAERIAGVLKAGDTRATDFAARIQNAAAVAAKQAMKSEDGEHKQWVICRMLEAMLGTNGYNAWRRERRGWSRGSKAESPPSASPGKGPADE